MELKVCKECGEKPEAIQSISFRHGSEKYIDCRKCGIRILGRSDLQVVEKWNKRNTPKDKIVETITRYDIFDCPTRGKILTQQDHGFFVKLSDHQEAIEQLQETIEKLKCCGNCRNQGFVYGEDVCLIDETTSCKTNWKTADKDHWKPLTKELEVSNGK